MCTNFSDVILYVRQKFLISSFRRVQNVVCFLLGDSPASDLYMPTFRYTLSVPSSKADGTDRVFRNVGIYKSDAGESPKRKQTKDRNWQHGQRRNVNSSICMALKCHTVQYAGGYVHYLKTLSTAKNT